MELIKAQPGIQFITGEGIRQCSVELGGPGGKLLTVLSLAIEPTHRRKGIGRRTLFAIMREARRLNLKYVFLNVMPIPLDEEQPMEVADLKRFYRSCGFTESNGTDNMYWYP
jgi:GNAT superfamily N-acetyltransferase